MAGAIDLARAAPGREGLALALTATTMGAVSGTGIEPATQAGAAESEVARCWAAGRAGDVRLVEFLGPLAEARLAAARGDTAADATAMRHAGDGGQRVASTMLVLAVLAGLACASAVVGDTSEATAAIAEAPPNSTRA